MDKNYTKILLTINLEGGCVSRDTNAEVTKLPKKRIKLTQLTYEHFISNEGCPRTVKTFIWKGYSPKQRLITQLHLLSQHHQGKSFSYEVLKR